VLDLLERASHDAVVIDEAHHCAEVGATGDRGDSLRRRLAELDRKVRTQDPTGVREHLHPRGG